MARKGYSTIEQQIAANKRYYENNEEAKEKRKRYSYKSNGKKFILEYATEEELLDIKEMVEKRLENFKKPLDITK